MRKKKKIVPIKSKELCRHCEWNYNCDAGCEGCEMFLEECHVCICLTIKDGEECGLFRESKGAIAPKEGSV